MLGRVAAGARTSDESDLPLVVCQSICAGDRPHGSSEALGLDPAPFPYKMTTICFVGPSAYVPVHSALTLFRSEFESRVAPSRARTRIPVVAVGGGQ